MQSFADQEFASTDQPCNLQHGPEEQISRFQTARNPIVRDVEFINCSFVASQSLASFGKPVSRAMAQNVHLKNCRLSFSGTGAILDNVLVERIQSGRGGILFNACALRHVTIKGEIGRTIFNRAIKFDNDERNEEFQRANDEFNAGVDWALDITQMSASSFELRGSIPIELVRRNPDE